MQAVERSHQARLTHGRGPLLPARGPARPVPGAHARRMARPRALPLELLDADVASAALQLLHHAPLAATPVASPCSLMNCGDVIHRRYAAPVLYLFHCVVNEWAKRRAAGAACMPVVAAVAPRARAAAGGARTARPARPARLLPASGPSACFEPAAACGRRPHSNPGDPGLGLALAACRLRSHPSAVSTHPLRATPTHRGTGPNPHTPLSPSAAPWTPSCARRWAAPAGRRLRCWRPRASTSSPRRVRAA